ncbi:MAG: hypothetical protein A2087_05165 [Spirochaetes bacterium GWD1_61_31]|nr:MAG: hypothetical protein A2Y37_00910 [Spirochaetes bacterium GWB1_60_80]OHD35384.1 MAG: hypothetical protein A2004_09150 [Spirochaetes bacterium GWC1_61_12]OHD36534.1 MAG: hypothetical protein A2087_05165 [Spirochaetes bacterium GWD1_61_31]OHD42248.1 MAG: hypothetical protein A2Y35_09360 [Spirochaetes bacterium GWE1_60_18]OHD58177.1 MAG: hypothetical protein A2Y32_14930 [Spirochaetes bacterium GWF1_60_12]HBO40897.1 hypothetical protein [Spirochaetaceae bacterium]
MNHEKTIDLKMLFPPNMNYDYFKGSELVPFDGSDQGFSLATAWWLAEISLLVYEHPGFIKWVLHSMGAGNYRFFSGATAKVAVFTLNRACIVTFRGTEIKNANFLPDALADVQFGMTKFHDLGKVHKGFKSVFDEVLTAKLGLPGYLDEILESGQADKIFFTGHSLGGALATLASAYYRRQVASLYSFGTPKVGNEEFCANFPVQAWRFVTAGDPVPYLPPNLPGFAKESTKYAHIGTMMYFDEQRRLQPNATEAPLDLPALIGKNIHTVSANLSKKARGFLDRTVDKKLATFIRDANIDAHAPALYATYLWNFLVTQQFNPQPPKA